MNTPAVMDNSRSFTPNRALPNRTLPGSAFLALLLVVALAVPVAPAHAQLQEVEQTVFGMDCAPCAYGLEKQMKGFEGVESVAVSLNEGRATLQLAPGNDVTLEALRTAITESGFSAEGAKIQVAGTLTKEDGAWVLVSDSGERFLLKEAPQSGSSGNTSSERVAAGERMAAGKRVTVRGAVPEGTSPAEGRWVLHVETLRSAT